MVRRCGRRLEPFYCSRLAISSPLRCCENTTTLVYLPGYGNGGLRSGVLFLFGSGVSPFSLFRGTPHRMHCTRLWTLTVAIWRLDSNCCEQFCINCSCPRGNLAGRWVHLQAQRTKCQILTSACVSTESGTALDWAAMGGWWLRHVLGTPVLRPHQPAFECA